MKTMPTARKLPIKIKFNLLNPTSFVIGLHNPYSAHDRSRFAARRQALLAIRFATGLAVLPQVPALRLPNFFTVFAFIKPPSH